jgi:hypothetical protein
MGNLGDASFTVGDDNRVEFNDCMSLGNDVRSDFERRVQLLSHINSGVIANFAADVNPRAKDDILRKRHVGESEDLSGMDQSLGAMDWLRFANFVEVGGKHSAVDC